jgi:hypothetical protein
MVVAPAAVLPGSTYAAHSATNGYRARRVPGRASGSISTWASERFPVSVLSRQACCERMLADGHQRLAWLNVSLLIVGLLPCAGNVDAVRQRSAARLRQRPAGEATTMRTMLILMPIMPTITSKPLSTFGGSTAPVAGRLGHN